jgi:hypothetical protein
LDRINCSVVEQQECVTKNRDTRTDSAGIPKLSDREPAKRQRQELNRDSNRWRRKPLCEECEWDQDRIKMIIENPDVSARQEWIQIREADPGEGIGIDSKIKVGGAMKVDAMEKTEKQNTEQ